MKLDTIKDLKALMALCRKNNVLHIKFDMFEMTLGPEPVKKQVLEDIAPDLMVPEAQVTVPQFNGMTTKEYIEQVKAQYPNTDIETPDELAGEALLFYSSDTTNSQQ